MEDIQQIINIIYDNYLDDNLNFNEKSFKEDYPNEYQLIVDKFENINNFFVYLSINKKNNKFISSLNNLKNYLVLSYIEQCRFNGLTYNDIIENTDFNYNQIRTLYLILKKDFNIKDIFK